MIGKIISIYSMRFSEMKHSFINEKKMWLSAIVLGVVISSAKAWWNGQVRENEYIKHVHPQVNISLSQMSIEESAKGISFEKYKELHVQSCLLWNQLVDLSNDGKPSDKFSEKECIKLMVKTRPYAQQLLDKEAARTPANK